MVQTKDLSETVRVVILEYLEKHLKTTGRNIVSLKRVRRDTRNRLQSVDSPEDQSTLKDVIDDLCINGTLRLVEGEVYRFSL